MAAQALKIKEEQKKFVFPVVTALLLLFGFSYVASQSWIRLRSYESRLWEANRKMNAMTKLRELSEKEKSILTAFPTVGQKNEVIREFARWARSEGIEVSAIDPTEEVIAGSKFRKLTLVISGKGGYLQTMRFLKRVEAAPYFLLPTGVKLSGFDLETMRNQFRPDMQNEDFSRRDLQLEVSAFLVE